MAKAIRFFHTGLSFFDSSNLASGYKLFQYQAGTTTKANTYTDSAKGTANSNPMTLNSDGRLDQDVYIDQSMKFVLATDVAGDPPTSSVWTVDNASSVEQLWTTTSKTVDYTVVEDDKDKMILVDATSGAVTISLLAAATAGDGFRIIVKKTDVSANAVTIDGNSAETIDGAATQVISTQYDSKNIICDGSNWHEFKNVGNPTTLVDSNGNEVIILNGVASAVNEFTVTNAATGNAPEISATGDDSNIDIDLTPKGTGNTNLSTGGLELGGNEVLSEASSAASASIQLYEDTDNGSNYMGLKAPAAVTADVTLTLPDGDGTDGQALETDGSGILSWITPKVVQYVILTSTNDDTTTSASMQASSLTGAITPKSTSNKIVAVVFAPVSAVRAAGSPDDIYTDLRIRNTTNSTTLATSRVGRTLIATSSVAADSFGSSMIMGTETAPSTNATTYELQYASGTATNVTAAIQGSTQGPAMMLLLEMAG